MKKRIIALFLPAVLLAVMLSSCAPAKVKVNGAKIDNEIYTYFEDINAKVVEGEKLEECILSSIARYTAINSEFNNRSLTLSTPNKSKLSADVNNIWHLYGKYYEDIGVSKQTIYKIEQSKQYEQALLADYYGPNGASPVSEDTIKAFFNENYIAVRFVTGYLFNIDDNGATVTMTDEQRTNTVNSFNSVASMINNGTAIEEAVGSFGENTEVHDNVVSSFSEGTFPTGFFNAVKNIESGKAAAVTLGNYVFLVQRVDAFSEEYDYYSTYRSDCLNKMKGEEFGKVVDEWTKNYIAE